MPGQGSGQALRLKQQARRPSGLENHRKQQHLKRTASWLDITMLSQLLADSHTDIIPSHTPRAGMPVVARPWPSG